MDKTDKANEQPSLQECMKRVVREVGIFGALALLHDQFDNTFNLSHYETWPLIQSAIIELDKHLHEQLDVFKEHGITPLENRKE